MREIGDAAFTEIRAGVRECLQHDKSGHGMDHVERVETIALGFCQACPEANRDIVQLIALLHDVDDYKLIGAERARGMESATRIMTSAGVDKTSQTIAKHAISVMGYSKALRGVRPETIEGKIVSDADMCDAIGAGGIIRCLTYALSTKGSGVIFDKEGSFPEPITEETYNARGTTRDGDSFINHMFDKLLRLKTLMMTEPGQQEAAVRDQVMVDFLRSYFREQNVPQWSEFLETYLEKR